MNRKEKKLKTPKRFILSVLISLFTLAAFSQTRMGSTSIENEDSLQCFRSLSTYKEFFKHNLYAYAMESWREVFEDCPASSELIYVDGVTMYRSYIENAPDGPVRESLIDTLMLIYDRRIAYFGGEGNVSGRKGRDLLKYRSGNIEQVQDAYVLLKKSIELEGEESQGSVLSLFISASIGLNREERIDDLQAIDDYFLVVGILDQVEGKSSGWSGIRAGIDKNMLSADILSCAALDLYFEPQLEQNKDDKVFLEKVITFYGSTECYFSDIYKSALENLYNTEPGPESAHNLAILYISRNDFPNAASYLKLAVVGENIDNDTRASWFYELAIVSNANEDYCEAINYAREAIANKKDFGKAFLALGDAIVASRTSLGDELHKRAAFWAAADKYSQAALLDPSIAAGAKQKLADCADQYPGDEDIFFLDLKEGDTYLVGGCINEYTTVRSGK